MKTMIPRWLVLTATRNKGSPKIQYLSRVMQISYNK